MKIIAIIYGVVGWVLCFWSCSHAAKEQEKTIRELQHKIICLLLVIDTLKNKDNEIERNNNGT